jgi:hypothetical protein
LLKLIEAAQLLENARLSTNPIQADAEQGRGQQTREDLFGTEKVATKWRRKTFF